MSNLLEQASLVMIPSGYKEDVVYSVIPTSGAGDLTFTRASNGTRIDSNGNVEVVPWNLLSYSEEFNNTSGWTPDATNGSITITANYATAPNGTTTADRIQITKGTNYSQLYQTSSVISGAVYTISVYLKSLSGTPTITTLYDGTEKGTQTLTTDWVRYTFSFTATSSTVFPMIALYTGNSTSMDVLAWGFQLNIGSTAKPYFPTTDRLNVPRLTYQNGGGGCPSLLLEKQSTNLITYSEQFDNAVHYKLDVTITANNITSPDGTQNADKFTETTGTGEHIVYDIDSNATGTYTLSAFFKGGAGTIYPVLRLNGSSTTAYAGCIFDTSTGAVVNTFYNTYSAPTTKVENMGNGWYRVSMTTTTTNANFGMRIAASNSTSPSVGAYGAISYTGSTSNYFYVWGAQLEASSYPTSYIPTTSSSATRVADACYKTGISSLIGQTQGTLFADFVITGLESLYGSAISVNDGVANNYIWLTIFANGNLRAEVWNGSVQASITYSGAVVGGRYKMAFGYNTNDFALYVNGSLVGTDTSGSTFSGTTLSRIDNNLAGIATNNVSQSTNQWALFPTRLTNSELAQLTGNQNYTINQAYASYGVASESPNCVQP